MDRRRMAELLQRKRKIERLRSLRQMEGEEHFRDFTATELYCPKCRAAMPVRERLLLVLPDGDLYEYLCARCSTSVGEKKSTGRENIQLVF